MHRIKLLLIAIIVLVSAGMAMAAGNVQMRKETFVFAIEDGDTLRMDKYSGIVTTGGPRPVVLFAFGGGFKGGDRATPTYVAFFHKLVEQGYTVVSTDYRTALASLSPSQVNSAGAFVSLLQELLHR